MSVTIPIEEADEELTALIARVREGEVFTITVDGEAVAQISPVEAPPVRRRVPGSAKGQIVIAPDFDDPLPDDILAEWGL